jgi:hypothetical protein
MVVVIVILLGVVGVVIDANDARQGPDPGLVLDLY